MKAKKFVLISLILILVSILLFSCSSDDSKQDSSDSTINNKNSNVQNNEGQVSEKRNFIEIINRVILGRDSNSDNTNDEEIENNDDSDSESSDSSSDEGDSEDVAPNIVRPRNNGDSAGVTDASAVFKVANLGLPQLGVSFQDPTFGTNLIRLGNAKPGEMFRHEYSQLQAFNADSSLVLINTGDGAFEVYDINNLEKVFAINFPVNALRWDPVNPNELIHFDENGDANSNGNVKVVLQKTNVRTGNTRDIFTFPETYVRVAGPQSWEEPSRNAKWTAAYLVRTDGQYDIVSVDMQNGKMGAVLTQASGYGRNTGSCREAADLAYEPNWVAASPLGNYLVVQWNRDGLGACEGVEVFDINNGRFIAHVAASRAHSDMGLDTDGSEIYVTVNFKNDLLITKTKFPGKTNFETPETAYEQIILSPGWNHMDHISCQGPKGLCVVSAGYPENNNDESFNGEIYMIYTSGTAADNRENANAKVRRLAHHRSTSCDYYHEPHPSISLDGSFVIFASDWSNCDNGVNSYIVDLRNADISDPA
ncbi:MAG TPA: hypothetical protein VJI68_02985 [Candidatus Nanoarchaeia archaeon]|nr:hypothetical protein [Candidatus Nanoarchaeia archaeon]